MPSRYCTLWDMTSSWGRVCFPGELELTDTHTHTNSELSGQLSEFQSGCEITVLPFLLLLIQLF